MQNLGILLIFHNPEIPGLEHRQSQDSGLRKSAGIPGFGIGIPKCDTDNNTYLYIQTCVYRYGTSYNSGKTNQNHRTLHVFLSANPNIINCTECIIN